MILLEIVECSSEAKVVQLEAFPWTRRPLLVQSKASEEVFSVLVTQKVVGEIEILKRLAVFDRVDKMKKFAAQA